MKPRPACAEEVASGVYRLGSRWANFYMVVEGGEGILVDAGYPRYLAQLERVCESLGMAMNALQAVFVTHHHVDHTGCAEAVRSRAGASVYVGEADAGAVEGERPSHPPRGFYRQVWRATMLRYLAHTISCGGARYRPINETTPPEATLPLDLPGRPRVIPTPGHTAGHYSLLCQDRGVLFTGDSLVNFDYASGTPGVRLHRFNEDRALARESLQRLAKADPELVVFGHGDPWAGDLRVEIERVRNQP